MTDITRPFASLPDAGFIGCRIEFFPDDGPLEHPFSTDMVHPSTYLRFGPGVTALYGPNGVGKSRVLKALKRALCNSSSEFTTTLFLKDPPDYLVLEQVMEEKCVNYPDQDGDLQNLVDEDFGSREPQRTTSFYLQEHHASESWSSGRRRFPLSRGLANEIAHEGLYCIAFSKNRTILSICISDSSSSGMLIDQLSRIRDAIMKPLDDPAFAIQNADRILGDHTSVDLADLLKRAEQPIDFEDYILWFEFESNWIWELRDLYPVIDGMNLHQLFDYTRPGWVPISLGDMPFENDYFADYGVPLTELGNFDIDTVEYHADCLLRGTPVEDVKRKGDEIAVFATKLLGEFLDAAPTLACSVPYHSSTFDGVWALGDAPRWIALDRSGEWVYLSDLSDTELRWASCAIALAWTIMEANTEIAQSSRREGPTTRKPLVVFCDEPERGLPFPLQMRLSQAFSTISETYGISFVLATHSAAILSDPNIHLNRVQRPGIRVDVVEVSDFERSRLTAVGVPPQEMSHLYRVILLVEGVHDEWVIDEMIGSVLDELRVKVLPVHGVGKAASLLAVDAGFLFEHLPDACFVFAVDGSDSAVLDHLVDAARKAGEIEQRLRDLDEYKAQISAVRLSNETEVIHTLLRRALESDRIDRVGSVFGFKRADIIEYLTCSAVVPGHSWEDLRAEHANEREHRPDKTPRDFKKWLETKYGARFDERSIRDAVPPDSIPAEFTDLLERCRELAARPS